MKPCALRRPLWTNADTDRPDTVLRAVPRCHASTCWRTSPAKSCASALAITPSVPRPAAAEESTCPGGEGGEPRYFLSKLQGLARNSRRALPSLYSLDFSSAMAASTAAILPANGPSHSDWPSNASTENSAALDGTPRSAAPLRRPEVSRLCRPRANAGRARPSPVDHWIPSPPRQAAGGGKCVNSNSSPIWYPMRSGPQTPDTVLETWCGI